MQAIESLDKGEISWWDVCIGLQLLGREHDLLVFCSPSFLTTIFSTALTTMDRRLPTMQVAEEVALNFIPPKSDYSSNSGH